MSSNPIPHASDSSISFIPIRSNTITLKTIDDIFIPLEDIYQLPKQEQESRIRERILYLGMAYIPGTQEQRKILDSHFNALMEDPKLNISSEQKQAYETLFEIAKND